MATADPDDVDRCEVLAEVAFEKMEEECGPEAAREILKKELGVNAADPDCDDVLEGGVTDDVVDDLTMTRRYVFCRANELIDDMGISRTSAVSMAWAEVDEARA